MDATAGLLPQDVPAGSAPEVAAPPTQMILDYIDQHRDAYGVEPICNVSPIAPATYYVHSTRKRNPELRSAR